MREWLALQGHKVLIATGTVASQGEEGVWVYPENGRIAWFERFCFEKQITHVLWQYSPYALHPKGLAGWVNKVANSFEKGGIHQSVYFHEVQIRYSVPGIFNKIRAWQQHRIANMLAQLCKGSIATSIPFYLRYFDKQKPVCIPVPANIPVIPGNRSATNDSIVVFANRALPAVIQALAIIQQGQPGIKVIFLGNLEATQKRATTESMATAGLRARFTGVVSVGELAAELQAASLVLLPQPLGAKGEGGISLKNGTLSAAMAAGLPVIATRGDMTDTSLLVHGHNIHLLNANSTEDWYKAIHHLLGDTAYREKLGHEALQFHERHLAWPVVGNQLFELLTG